MKLHLHDEIFDVTQQQVTMVVTATNLTHGRFRVLKLQEDSEAVMSLQTLAEQVSENEVMVRRPGAPLVSPAMQDDKNLDSATARAMRIAHEVREYSRRHHVSACAAYAKIREKRQAVADSDNVGHYPSRATVYRYLVADRKELPILCGAKNKGNRVPRYDDRVQALIVEIAKTQFLQPESRWSVRAVTQFCNLQAHDDGLLAASRSISRKFVQKVIFENLSTDAEWDRMDPRARAAQKAIAKNRIRVDGMLQRVEQDALHLPWYVRTPAGDAKNIWLVHAIDCATSMPVGWHIVVGAPNASSGMQCVESILFSKREKFAELGLDCPIDCYGAPSRIVFDNGSEAKNDRMSNLVRLRIDLQYCKSRHPHHKPYIERLNRSLKEALETLPGCTRLDGVDGERDPEKLNDLPMSLHELEQWIVRWYYEVWANTVLTRLIRSDFSDDRKLGGTPRARFESLNAGGYAMPLPPNRDSWLLTKYHHEERTLARTTGITYDTFHFRGPNLDMLIARNGARPVKVLVDPDDFRTVQVVQGDVLVPLLNIDVDETTPALSFSEAKRMHDEAEAAAKASGAKIVAAFRRDLFTASLHVPIKTGAAKKGGATERAQQVARKAKTQAAEARARAKPLPATTPEQDDMGEFSLSGVPSLQAIHRSTGATL
jgi:putative transposase